MIALFLNIHKKKKNDMHDIDSIQILFFIFEIIFVLLFVSCEIKKRRYIETEAEIIGYRIDKTGESYREGLIPMKIVTYRYYWNGTEYTESETVLVSKKKLAETKTCSIYVDPHNNRKFVTPFQISMWRIFMLIGLVFVVLSIPMYIV